MGPEREVMAHFLAAIAYRAQKALRDAPPNYPDFSAGHRVRTPVEILRHMTSLMGYAVTQFDGGSYPMHPEPLPTFQEEIERFHQMVELLGSRIASNTPLREISEKQLLQGPLSDAMTHVGQLALLRRMAGAPTRPENFIFADVRPDRLGSAQPMPARPDEFWPEAPA